MNYTQEQFRSTPLNTVDYITLDNPVFEGQTSANENGDYIMYFSCNGILYGFSHNLFK